MTFIIAGGMFAAVYLTAVTLSNAYDYFFCNNESFEQLLYNAIPSLEKMNEEELDDLSRVIGRDARKSSFKWMW
jgi:hypothetical protein